MAQKPSHDKLPKRLETAKDALWPEYLMSPRQGKLKRVVLLPTVRVNMVTTDQWRANVKLSRPEYDLEAGKMDPVEADSGQGSPEVSRRTFEERFKERYGKDWKDSGGF
jgi:hypothetical protein